MNIQNKIDEKKLVQRLVAGEETAFEIIFYRYRGKVGNFIRNSAPVGTDWEGLVLEVFLRIWMNRERLDTERPFEAYLFRAAKNIVVDELRKKIGRSVYLQEGTFARDFGVNETENKIEDRELQSWLEAMLDKIPSQRRLVFMMNRFEGLSYREIAGKLNISENTVDTQIRRTLQFFRAELKKLNTFFLLFF